MNASTFLPIATEAALAAAELIRAATDRPAEFEFKGEIDLVTATDRAAEAVVRDRLERGTPFGVLGEEGGASGAGSGPTWIVDPIDGTTNFVLGIPHFAVSIGLWDGDEALGGVIVQPMTREIWTVAETGLRFTGRAADAPHSKALHQSVLATGYPYDVRTNPDDNLRESAGLIKRARGIRRMGSAALDLAWVATGRLDGYWERGLKPWDVAAGIALCRAAGHIVVNYDGAPYRLTDDGLIAGPPELVNEMLTVVGESRKTLPGRPS